MQWCAELRGGSVLAAGDGFGRNAMHHAMAAGQTVVAEWLKSQDASLTKAMRKIRRGLVSEGGRPFVMIAHEDHHLIPFPFPYLHFVA